MLEQYLILIYLVLVLPSCLCLSSAIAKRKELGVAPILFTLLSGPIGVILVLRTKTTMTCPRCNSKNKRPVESTTLQCQNCEYLIAWRKWEWTWFSQAKCLCCAFVSKTPFGFTHKWVIICPKCTNDVNAKVTSVECN